MFFAKPGIYKPCGIFTIGHLSLFLITIGLIMFVLKRTVKSTKKEVKTIIQVSMVVLWILEILRIIFNFIIGNGDKPNEWLPLYYCSLLLYAGTLSAFCKGKFKRIGDSFLATGAIIGGAVFMMFPTTTLPQYPLFHFLSLHSFLYHGTMVYLGLLVNITNYIDIKFEDLKYYAVLVGSICAVAFIVNKLFNCNLMFISQNFPGTPIEIIYNLTGPLFTLIMEIGQMTVPFLVIYEIRKVIKKKKVYRAVKVHA